MPGWEPVIGLECHVQLQTRSKIFCSCATTFGAPPNENTCPVCLGHPGTLPTLNRRAVEMGLLLAMATGANLTSSPLFARKNYFYPDLPKGYQISQFDRPLAQAGAIEIDGRRRVGLIRIHLEEDAGKLIHEGPDADRFALVDFNRAGVPLAEVVSKPEIRSPVEAAAYLEALRTLVTHLGICDGSMEEGSLRCDANVSVHHPGTPLGTRTEIKNLNSFRNVERALAHEIARHSDMRERGERIPHETRGFDAESGRTYPMRDKEEEHDYRYFPDPDLLPVDIVDTWVASLRETLPELPVPRLQRFLTQYGIGGDDATLLISERRLADYFEAVAGACGNPRAAANWILRDIRRAWRAGESPVRADDLAALLRLIDGGQLSTTAARDVLAAMVATGRPPDGLVAELGLTQVSDADEIEAVVARVIADNGDAAASYRAGKHKALGVLVGAVMRATQGRANPRLASELLVKLLGE